MLGAPEDQDRFQQLHSHPKVQKANPIPSAQGGEAWSDRLPHPVSTSPCRASLGAKDTLRVLRAQRAGEGWGKAAACSLLGLRGLPGLHLPICTVGITPPPSHSIEGAQGASLAGSCGHVWAPGGPPHPRRTQAPEPCLGEADREPLNQREGRGAYSLLRGALRAPILPLDGAV